MTTPPPQRLSELREEIARLDRALLETLERRLDLASEVGRIKAERDEPVVVREVEHAVRGRARDHAARCGVSGEVMEAIFDAVIRASVERQHRVGVERRASGGRRILVLGAAGGMGGWLTAFHRGIGQRVDGVDPAWRDLPRREGRWAALDRVPSLDAYDAIVVSTTLETVPAALDAVRERRPRGVVLEVASIKSHLDDAMHRLRDDGLAAVSIHPMFGPTKSLYTPLTVVHAAVDEEPEREALLDLLGHPYLDLVSVPFDRHDRLMGWLLGLAHLTGMVFADALGRSGLDPRELERVASTTFARQAATSRSVFVHDPGLYFAIQRLNPHRGRVYAALTAAIGELTGAVEADDPEAFAAAMARAAASLPPGTE